MRRARVKHADIMLMQAALAAKPRHRAAAAATTTTMASSERFVVGGSRALSNSDLHPLRLSNVDWQATSKDNDDDIIGINQQDQETDNEEEPDNEEEDSEEEQDTEENFVTIVGDKPEVAVNVTLAWRQVNEIGKIGLMIDEEINKNNKTFDKFSSNYERESNHNVVCQIGPLLLASALRNSTSAGQTSSSLMPKSYPNNTLLEDLSKCHHDITYVWPQASRATTSTINLIRSCWSTATTTTTKTPPTTTTPNKKPKKILPIKSQSKVINGEHSTVIDFAANIGACNNDLNGNHNHINQNNINNNIPRNNDINNDVISRNDCDRVVQQAAADRLTSVDADVSGSSNDRHEVATTKQPKDKFKRKRFRYYMPTSILRVNTSLRPDEYNRALSVLNGDIRFKLHLLLYRRIQTIWILFSTIFCLAFPILFTNLDTLIILCTSFGWLVLQAVGTLLTSQFRKKLDQMLEKSIAQVNSYFLDHNLMLGVINSGSLFAKTRLLIPMLYFDTSHCREQIESIISIDLKKDADDKNDKRTLDYSKIGLPLTKSNNVMALAQSQLAKKIVLRFSQRWISYFDKRKLMFTDDKIEPRHLSTGKCLCQFIEEHFKNDQFEKKKFNDSIKKEQQLNHINSMPVTTIDINDHDVAVTKQPVVESIVSKTKHKKTQSFHILKKKSKRKSSVNNKPVFVDVSHCDRKITSNDRKQFDTILRNYDIAISSVPTLSQEIRKSEKALFDTMDGDDDDEQRYGLDMNHLDVETDVASSINGDDIENRAVSNCDQSMNKHGSEHNLSNLDGNNNINSINNDEHDDLIRKLRLLLELRKNQLNGMTQDGNFGLYNVYPRKMLNMA